MGLCTLILFTLENPERCEYLWLEAGSHLNPWLVAAVTGLRSSVPPLQCLRQGSQLPPSQGTMGKNNPKTPAQSSPLGPYIFMTNKATLQTKCELEQPRGSTKWPLTFRVARCRSTFVGCELPGPAAFTCLAAAPPLPKRQHPCIFHVAAK